MKLHPPAPADTHHIARFARIGLVPGQDFEASTLRADCASCSPSVRFDRITLQARITLAVTDIDGWTCTNSVRPYVRLEPGGSSYDARVNEGCPHGRAYPQRREDEPWRRIAPSSLASTRRS